jgi:stage V sporulation protein R
VKKFDSGKDWSPSDLEELYTHIERIATDKFGLSFYPNQIEVITSEQMLDAYSSVGMPVYYSHWSFGKQFVKEQEAYRRGQMGLAYEIVINSSPCISYLMEENTVAMQALVMAHACIGHNSFFKNNATFKQWTDASAIIDYLVFAKQYIADCEDRYGVAEVERVLDAAHALRLQGIDRYKRPAPLSRIKEEERRKARQDHEQYSYNDIWRTLPPSQRVDVTDEEKKFPPEPEENLLYFIEKHAPNLEQWKREIVRIVRKVAQYFYPQQLTQIMNEGWASFWHYTILHELYEEGLVTDGFMLEILTSHTGVVHQRPFSAINPYALGFAMYQDIKRISMEPTAEDREWFPEWAGNGDWVSTLKFASQNFKDESFILQYLSPKVIRDFGLFYILDDDTNPTFLVEAIQNDEGYRTVRAKLSEQQNFNNRMPNIQVTEVDVWGDRSITLTHQYTNRRALESVEALKTLEHFKTLWGYTVHLESVDATNKVIHTYTADAR